MKIDRMTTGTWGKIKAFFDLSTEEGIVIKGFKLIEGINGLFVGMPSVKNAEGKYDNIAIIPDAENMDAVTELAKQKYDQEKQTKENWDNGSNDVPF